MSETVLKLESWQWDEGQDFRVGDVVPAPIGLRGRSWSPAPVPGPSIVESSSSHRPAVLVTGQVVDHTRTLSGFLIVSDNILFSVYWGPTTIDGYWGTGRLRPDSEPPPPGAWIQILDEAYVLPSYELELLIEDYTSAIKHHDIRPRVVVVRAIQRMGPPDSLTDDYLLTCGFRE